MSSQDKGRLGRWSRLKQQKKAGAALDETQVADLTEGPDAGKTPAAEAPVEPVVDLPTVESLGKDSDYTPFLREGVPEELAKAALRRMWRSDPSFNIRDGLDDYDEDFRIVSEIVKAVTSKPGKGKKKAKTEKKTAAKSDKTALETKKAPKTKAGGQPEKKKAKKKKKAKPPRAQEDKGETNTAEVPEPSDRSSS